MYDKNDHEAFSHIVYDEKGRKMEENGIKVLFDEKGQVVDESRASL